jgi:hypothetical protein
MSIYVPPRIAVPLPVKAGPIGPGAGVLMTEYPLFSFLKQDPPTKMRTAYQMGMSVPWIRRAEMVIGSKIATVDFDLDDPDDTEIDGAYPNADAVAAWELLQRPQANLGVGAPLSRSSLWRLTSRHVGLCGNAFWLLDQPEAFSGTPNAIVYLRPDRMTPDEDAAGNLTGWTIDKKPGKPGISVKLDQVVHFMLEPPDTGHFGPGLVETALIRGQLSIGLDKHLAQVIQAGGRLSGIVSPKSGVVEGETLLQMERDWRTITEQPDAAKRLQLIAAPVDFQQTTMTPDELDLARLMELMRDDLLAIWNVPGSLIGVKAPQGLNSGESRKYDEAALWQGPVHDRLVIFSEGLETILGRWQKRIGWVPTLVIEEPAFDDEAPRYDLLAKSLATPLRNRERREIIGLEPLGDPILDEAVWLPFSQNLAFTAPDEEGKPIAVPVVVAPAPPEDRAIAAAAETSLGKARLDGVQRTLAALRATFDARYVPKLRDGAKDILAEQRAEVDERIRRNADHITANPRDTSVWWDARKWNDRLRSILAGPITGMAELVTAHVREALPAKADPIDAAERALTQGGTRISAINERTRQAIVAFISDGIEQGLSPAALADTLDAVTLDNGAPLFDELRAETIARSEMMAAYNGAALSSYSDAGLQMVEAIDGDKDEECAARNGRTFTITEAEGISDHPNGTLDWVPIIGEVKASDDVNSAEYRELKAMLGEMSRRPAPILRIDTTPEIPAPIVNVPQALAPIVNLDTTAFASALDRLTETIRSQPAPVVHVAAPVVNIPEPKPRRRIVHRDPAGQITEVTEE